MSTSEALRALEGLLQAKGNPLSGLANTSAFLWELLPDINWTGFYLLDRGALWLGPFQGKVACTRIEINRGVCGAAFSQDRTLIVPDVHAFPGHIACDAASRAEIVLPIHAFGRPIGVLDIDSPTVNRFTEGDHGLLAEVVALVEAYLDFAPCGYDLEATGLS